MDQPVLNEDKTVSVVAPDPPFSSAITSTISSGPEDNEHTTDGSIINTNEVPDPNIDASVSMPSQPPALVTNSKIQTGPSDQLDRPGPSPTYQIAGQSVSSIFSPQMKTISATATQPFVIRPSPLETARGRIVLRYSCASDRYERPFGISQVPSCFHNIY